MSTTTPNMNLILPTVGETPGPDYAQEQNNSMTIIDQHDHTSGKGVAIPADGININSELTMNNNTLAEIKSLEMQVQGALISGSVLRSMYSFGDDLYFNDGAGNQIQITDNGNVAGTPGSIANLTSPASASYVALNSTFVWQSDANTPADMDGGSVILRNLSANSNGVTLSAPAALASDYDLVLPQLPASTKIMALDSAGNISAPYAVDNSSIEISSNTIQVKARGITNLMGANNVRTLSASGAVLTSDNVVLGDTTSGAVTMTLPTAVGNRCRYVLEKTSADANYVILATTGGQTIGGSASAAITLQAPGDAIEIQADGTNYQILNRRSPLIYGQRTRTTDQSIPNDALTLLQAASTAGNLVAFSGSAIDILYDGRYTISANLRYPQNAAGSRILFIFVDGLQVWGQTIPGSNAGGYDNYLSASVANIALSAGQSIEVYTYQNSSGTLALNSLDSFSNNLMVRRVGYFGEG